MAELVDAHVSGACVRKDVGVRLPLSAHKEAALYMKQLFHLFRTLSRRLFFSNDLIIK
jgi:hypothetical protein